jgi:hypothetical protein
MPAVQRKKISISILIPFLIVILFFSSMVWHKYRSSQETQIPSSFRTGEGSRSITLFFAADGTRLAREMRTIEGCDDDNICLKYIVDELLNGPVSGLEGTVPVGTVVNAVRIKGPLAVIEFSRAFADGMPAGSSAEMMAVYSVVNTVAVNFPNLQNVKLTVSDNQEDHLRHLDLSQPLAPDYSLEQIAVPGPEQPSGGSLHDKHGGQQ